MCVGEAPGKVLSCMYVYLINIFFATSIRALLQELCYKIIRNCFLTARHAFHIFAITKTTAKWCRHKFSPRIELAQQLTGQKRLTFWGREAISSHSHAKLMSRNLHVQWHFYLFLFFGSPIICQKNPYFTLIFMTLMPTIVAKLHLI